MFDIFHSHCIYFMLFYFPQNCEFSAFFRGGSKTVIFISKNGLFTNLQILLIYYFADLDVKDVSKRSKISIVNLPFKHRSDIDAGLTRLTSLNVPQCSCKIEHNGFKERKYLYFHNY